MSQFQNVFYFLIVTSQQLKSRMFPYVMLGGHKSRSEKFSLQTWRQRLEAKQGLPPPRGSEGPRCPSPVQEAGRTQ